MQQALEWFYRADIFDAAEALEKGLVRSVHAPEDLVEAACAFARSLVTNRSPVSIGLIRQMVLGNAAQSHPRAAHDVEFDRRAKRQQAFQVAERIGAKKT